MLRPVSPRRSSPFRSRLRLEVLELRDCPSTVSLNLTPGTNPYVTLSGSLTDTDQVANQRIDFSGPFAGTPYTTTDTDGNFLVTLQATDQRVRSPPRRGRWPVQHRLGIPHPRRRAWKA